MSYPPPGARRKATAEPKGFVETRLAVLCRAVYERERSAYDSLTSGRKVRYQSPAHFKHRVALRYADDDGNGPLLEPERDSTWEKLAAFFLRSRIDPELYIRLQFEPAALRLLRPPEPPQLRTPERLELYEQAKASLGNVLALSLSSQRSIASAEVAFVVSAGRSTADACAAVLTNDGLELSPLFRYCLARSMTGKRFQDLARLFLETAVLQFVHFREAYEKHWKDYLPVGFPAMADRLYQTFIVQ